MKAEIFVLLARGYSTDEIIALTHYPKGMIYRYRMLYKKAVEKIDLLKLEVTK